MKKIAVLLVVAALIAWYAALKSKPKESYLVKINDYTITAQRFEQDFKDSAFGKENTPQSRKEFLQSLVQRKLILQDAQAKGLDKDKDFLLLIQRFWEQSLLQRAIERKNQEIAGSVHIPDKAVEEAYKKLQSEGKAEKPYEQMYSQLKWSLTRQAEAKAMEQWVSQLMQSADIRVNGMPGIKINSIGGGDNGQ